jgi:hypothetical protein
VTDGKAGADSEGRALADLYELATTFCKASLGCCSGSGSFPNVASCIDAVVARIPVTSILSGAVVVDTQGVATCRTAIAATANCRATPPHACRDLYIPTLRPGEACRDYRECVQEADGVDCVLGQPDVSPGGVCTVVTPGKAGERCLSTCPGDGPCPTTISGTAARVCHLPQGLYCDTTDEVPTCKPVLHEGDLCGDFYSCGVDAECYYDCVMSDCQTLCENAPGWIGCEELGCDGDSVCINHACESPANFGDAPGCSSALLSF